MQSEGVVRNIIATKNFGFIFHGRDEYFFHRADFKGHWDDLLHDFGLGKRIKVQFLAQKTIKGLRAYEVSRLDWPNQSSPEIQPEVNADSL